MSICIFGTHLSVGGCQHGDKKHHRPLHMAAHRGHTASARLLIDAKADLEARNTEGATPLEIVSGVGNLACLQVLIESKADVQTANNKGGGPSHTSAYKGHHKCLRLLIDANADVNARTHDGVTPAIFACEEDRLACLQLLVDAKADLSAMTNLQDDVVYWSMCFPTDQHTHRVPGTPFAVLSCNTDTKRIPMDEHLTPAMVNAHISEYKLVHTFIDEWHSIERGCRGGQTRGSPWQKKKMASTTSRSSKCFCTWG
jgi:hypothetical protein